MCMYVYIYITYDPYYKTLCYNDFAKQGQIRAHKLIRIVARVPDDRPECYGSVSGPCAAALRTETVYAPEHADLLPMRQIVSQNLSCLHTHVT